MISPYIYKQGNQRSDPCYVKTRVNDSRQIANYNLTNYRNQWKCNQKAFNTFNPIYNQQGIHNGTGLDCPQNVRASSDLLHSQLVTKPLDKLQEEINEERYYDYLPKKSGMYNITKGGICDVSFNTNSCNILTSTTVGPNPQRGYNPIFDRVGINTRDFRRKNEYWYKKQKHALNIENTMGSHGRFTKMR